MSSHPIVAITGASGVRYATRLLQVLIESRLDPYVLVSPAGRQVLDLELGTSSLKALLGPVGFREENVRDMASPLASGSFRTAGMVILPCSTGTLGALASGVNLNLIHRAAEVTLKEGRRLILVPRETPLSRVALRNMATLAEAGARILPASPGFYHRPKSVEDLVDFVVARVLDGMEIPHALSRRWTGLPAFEAAEGASPLDPPKGAGPFEAERCQVEE